MYRHVACLSVALAACPTPVSQDIQGSIVNVSVTSGGSDDCVPPRYLGDGGTQFFGFQKSGKPAISSSYEAFWGPSRVDGGIIAPGSRQDFVIDQEVNLVQGIDSARICGRVFYTWSSPSGGPPWVMQLNQRWEAIDLGCDSPGAQLPLTACNSTRLFTFTPLGSCALNCVQVGAASDITCACPK